VPAPAFGRGCVKTHEIFQLSQHTRSGKALKLIDNGFWIRPKNWLNSKTATVQPILPVKTVLRKDRKGVSGSYCLNYSGGTHYIHDPFPIVGQHMQTHFRTDVF
jgi:hypothetical protein